MISPRPAFSAHRSGALSLFLLIGGAGQPIQAQTPQTLVSSYELLTYTKTAPASMRPDSGGNWHENANDTATQRNNPWLHVRLTALVTPAPGTGRDPFLVPGYYVGSPGSLGSGNDWRVRLRAPDMPGSATVEFFFESGPSINVAPAPTIQALQAMTPSYVESFTAQGYLPLDQSMESRGFILPFYETGQLGCRYWRYSNGDIWIKGGIDSPENLLGFNEFQGYTDPVITNVAAANHPGGNGIAPEFWLHGYDNHVADWVPGDPKWSTTGPGGSTGHGKGIIGAVNWLSNNGANSIYLLLMNLGGDGRDVSPFVDTPAVAGAGGGGIFPFDSQPLVQGFDDSRLNYSVKRLHQWSRLFAHANSKGVFLNLVLAETEASNTNWLDDGTLVMSTQRKLFLKNMVAMFGHNLGVKWNLWEETPIGPEDDRVEVEDLTDIAHWIQSWDFVDYDPVRAEWIGHAITTHGFPPADLNPPSTLPSWWDIYRDLRDTVSDSDWWLDATSMQINGGEAGTSPTTGEYYGFLTEQVRADFLAGDQTSGDPGSSPRLVILDLDEQGSPNTGYQSDSHSTPATDATAEDRRKRTLFDALFSGAGGIEWYCGYHEESDGGGDLRIEDFRTRAELLATTGAVVEFLVEAVHGNPECDLFEFEPQDDLVTGEYDDSTYGDAEVFAQAQSCYLVYYPGLGMGGAGSITVDHGPTGKRGAILWYRAEDMSLVPSATQVLATASGLQTYSPTLPAGADASTDYVMAIFLR